MEGIKIYSAKIRWKLLLLIMAVFIGGASLWYTNKLVKKLAREERKKIEIWAEATKRIIDSDTEVGNFSFLLKIIQNNTTVPVIVVDEEENILMWRNLDSIKINNKKYIKRRLADMKHFADPIVISLPNAKEQKIYYDRSTILMHLSYYPFVQMSVIFIFIFIAYMAFSASRKAEQNQVWLGLSKETAHQLGTPISSLMAWYEMLKMKNIEAQMEVELSKDIFRLKKIAERFSKIGSKPKIETENLVEELKNYISYIKTRVPTDVNISLDTKGASEIMLPFNASLFEWVIENVCKNAVDAMDGIGNIEITTEEVSKKIILDISDTGKGIPKRKQKDIFKPGYSTKARGWGLGLSLAKRIVEEYHGGKIYVLNSDPEKGTTIRIVLKKQT